MRTAWAFSFAAASTFFFGSVVFVAALFRLRGRIYFWATSQWGRSLLWASASTVRIHGLDNVDWSKPQVLVSNHLGAFDILALAASVPVVATLSLHANHSVGDALQLLPPFIPGAIVEHQNGAVVLHIWDKRIDTAKGPLTLPV